MTKPFAQGPEYASKLNDRRGGGGASTDKAGARYWSQVWAQYDLPPPIDPKEPAVDNYVNRCFHQYFVGTFAGLRTSDMSLLEVGCARSVWLPYFATQFGFSVAGLDYSDLGCRQAKHLLADAGVTGEVICADVFSPPADMLDRFDVVVSFGLIEHFSDTAGCVGALAKFVRPGGLLVTNIPNMVGWIGLVEKLVNRPVYDIHVPLDVVGVATAHQRCGLQVVDCDYFVSVNFGVCNLNGVPSGTLGWRIKSGVLWALARLSKLVWILEQRFGPLPATRLVSPYINCVARRPGGK